MFENSNLSKGRSEKLRHRRSASKEFEANDKNLPNINNEVTRKKSSYMYFIPKDIDRFLEIMSTMMFVICFLVMFLIFLQVREQFPRDITSHDLALHKRKLLVKWYKKNRKAPLGLSCDPKSPIINYSKEANLAIPPPIFRPRIPQKAESPRVQVALVIPFVEFQISKIAWIFRNVWDKYPPCVEGSEKVDADLIFYTENELKNSMKKQILSLYHDLGENKVGCFNNDEPYFLSLDEIDSSRSHLEGAAYSFFSLFRLLETKYKAFMLAEPDVTPVQPNFLPEVVKKSKLLNCEQDGLWQLGQPPFVSNTEAGDLRKRVDYHMNGNAMYVLGCQEFEDYKCRVQTYYTPVDECEHVAGCSTHQAYEGGYDHALYQFRMQEENFEYARFVASKFQYTVFMQNRGEDHYDVRKVVESSPATYFVHSKSIFTTHAATTIREVGLQFKHDTCDMRKPEIYEDFKTCYRNLKTSEYSEADAIRHLCKNPAITYKEVCDLPEYKSKISWKNRMPNKTYLWTMDFHGGPTNCDIPIIQEAGGAIHAEIDGVCHFYGLCRDRLKVIRADNWHEYDPTEKQKEKFKLAYKNDPEFKRVDAFICHHPVANCELFLPFNRPIIIHATTRLEFGRHDGGIDWRVNSGYDSKIGKKKWAKWIKTLQSLSRKGKNIIAANNVYDQEYIKYFTGIKNVELIPNWCGDGIGKGYCDEFWDLTFNQDWAPERPEVMIVPYRSNLDRSRFSANLREPRDHPIIKDMLKVSKKIKKGTELKLISELYNESNPLFMLKHPAIVIIPYQVSTINLIELYRLNIPTFCPSLSLLKKWCIEHDLMWEAHYGWPERIISNNKDLHFEDVPDPNGFYDMDKNSDEWEQIFDHWMPFSDFYQNNVGIIYFDSWEDFFWKYNNALSDGTLEGMNTDMKEFNKQLRNELVEKWKDILARISKP